MNPSIRILWRRLGHVDAISVTTAAVVIALQVAGSILSALVDYREELPLFLGIRLIGLTALCAVLAAGKTALRLCPLPPVRPWITLTTFGLALTVGTAVFDALLVASKLAPEHALWRRLLIAAPGIISAMIVTAVLVGAALAITMFAAPPGAPA